MADINRMICNEWEEIPNFFHHKYIVTYLESSYFKILNEKSLLEKRL